MEYEKAKTIANHIKHNIKGLYISGSIRRKEYIINDIDFITQKDLSSLLDDIVYNYNLVKINRRGNDYMSLTIHTDYGDINLDFWKGNDDYEYKFLKWMRDMDKGHNIYYRKLAKNKGLTLSDRGLRKGDKYIHVNTKKNLIKALTKWDFKDKIFDNENNIKI